VGRNRAGSPRPSMPNGDGGSRSFAAVNPRIVNILHDSFPPRSGRGNAVLRRPASSARSATDSPGRDLIRIRQDAASPRSSPSERASVIRGREAPKDCIPHAGAWGNEPACPIPTSFAASLICPRGTGSRHSQGWTGRPPERGAPGPGRRAAPDAPLGLRSRNQQALRTTAGTQAGRPAKAEADHHDVVLSLGDPAGRSEEDEVRFPSRRMSVNRLPTPAVWRLNGVLVGPR